MDKKLKIKTELKAKLKQEMSVTGTGASVTPGVGAGVATKYAFGKRKNKGTPSDWKDAPSIPNRKSKTMDYKELWEDFKVGDKVTYLGHPAEITKVNKEMTGAITYNVSYDKGNGKTKASNIYNKSGDIKPLTGVYLNEEQLEEATIPDNIKKFAQRKGVTNIVNQVARWAEKAGYDIVGGTAIGKDYSTLILDLTYQGSEVYINTDNKTIEVKGEEVDNYNSFVKALSGESLNEGYAQFRNETKMRSKPEQFHQAVKQVKKKVNEINRLFEYMDRLKTELSEGESELKYKKYTENALSQIKESTKKLFFKSTKLK